MSEQWMSIVEYARAFSVSDMTVRRRIKTGKLSAILRDGKYYIPIDQETETCSKSTSPQRGSNSSFDCARPINNNGASIGDIDSSEISWSKNASLPIANGASTSSVELDKVLDYCYRSMNRINSIERHLNDTYRAKLGRLESEVRHRDLEIVSLKQQIEDLQILIKMYDIKGGV